MTAVIYARYSSDNQREESIEGQIRECTAYAEKNGITIVKHYIDRAISAKTDNRPEFQQMIKDSDKKLFDIVLVWKLDRFARNRYDSARYKTQLKKNGVKLMSATEIISEGPEGIILESVLEGYAGMLAERHFGLGSFHLYDVTILLGSLQPDLAIFVVFHLSLLPNLLRCARRSAHCAGAWWHLPRSCWLSARRFCRTCS